MKQTLLCITGLVLVLGLSANGQTQPLTTSTSLTTPINPTWTGSTTWNTNPTWGGNMQMWNRPFYNAAYQPQPGQTVYCYPVNTPMYRSFLPLPFGPIQEVGDIIGGYWSPFMKKK